MGSHAWSRLVLRSAGTVLVLALLAAFACDGGKEPVERVVLIGVDGLEWRVLEPLLAAGALPNLERFRAAGAHGSLDTLLPTFSPNIWATVATGRLPAAHGITGFTQRASDGSEVPFTSNSRRVPALWKILSDAGRRVAVVGWWTTWPAEPVEGVMVSDRMLYNRFNLLYGYAQYGADLPAQTHPPELAAELEPLARIPDDFERTFRERFAPEREIAFDRELHDPWYELSLVFARDDAYRRMLESVLARERFDFVAYYLNGPDIASHYFWKYRFPEEWDEPLAPEDVAEKKDVIDRYYRWVDEALVPLLAQAGPDTLVVVLSDHGFRTAHRGDSPNISGDHYNTAPPGVILLAGGGVPAGLELARASVADIAPTVLHVMGLPIARDMNGRVMPELERGEPEWIATYGSTEPGPGAAPIATEHDAAMVEKLRALGYLD